MTDLEICKRIAEIEGEIYHKPLYSESGGFLGLSMDFPYLKITYNPLKDKSLCLDLMIKYNISIGREADSEESDFIACDGVGCITDECPQRVVCLLIILGKRDD
jgi:hypothetical protein